jgi:hypothetical protein
MNTSTKTTETNLAAKANSFATNTGEWRQASKRKSDKVTVRISSEARLKLEAEAREKKVRLSDIVRGRLEGMRVRSERTFAHSDMAHAHRLVFWSATTIENLALEFEQVAPSPKAALDLMVRVERLIAQLDQLSKSPISSRTDGRVSGESL